MARARSSPKASKADHVRKAKQTRDHACHWPGCPEQVPPAMWGCRRHWFALPKPLRDRIWAAYRPGQEDTLSPSRDYLDAARAVQNWIAGQQRAAPARPEPLEADVASELASLAVHLATSPEDLPRQIALMKDEWSERAAIHEYLGGMSRRDAEREAVRNAAELLGVRFGT